MGITANYQRLSPEKFEEICRNSEAADTFFGYELEDDEFDAWFDELEASGRYLDIGKAWHGLHFLLTGSSDINDVLPPFGNVVMGGTDTQWESPYGMVRYLTPQEVKNCAQALEQMNETQLRRCYRPMAFRAADIYPNGKTWGENDIDYLIIMVDRVRTFFSEAAKAGEVVLISID